MRARSGSSGLSNSSSWRWRKRRRRRPRRLQRSRSSPSRKRRTPRRNRPRSAKPEKKKRRQLPPEFPRRDVVHAPPGVCKTCGGTELRTVSETVTEVLAYVPARFEVIRHVRPACSCRKCETMVQAPMPELPIPRGMVDASFLAHIVVAKFCDHLPLYRQAEIYARSGLDIDRSQLAEWLGHVAWLLRPARRADRRARHGGPRHPRR